MVVKSSYLKYKATVRVGRGDMTCSLDEFVWAQERCLFSCINIIYTLSLHWVVGGPPTLLKGFDHNCEVIYLRKSCGLREAEAAECLPWPRGELSSKNSWALIFKKLFILK